MIILVSTLVIIVVALTSIRFLKHKAVKEAAKVALDRNNFQPFKLIQRQQVSRDSFLFRFALHHPNQILELPIGQHIVFRGNCTLSNGKKEMVMHSYTPISSRDEKGYMDFLIKIYFPGVNPNYPKGGRLTQYIYNLKINDTIEMQGPKGRFEYLGNGNYTILTPPSTTRAFHVEALAMIAGGSGITPLLQIIRAIHKNPKDLTRIYLLYANQTPGDILLREELDNIAKTSEGKIKVWYTVDRDVPSDWPYDVGHINEKMLRAHMPAPQNFKENEDKEDKINTETNVNEKEAKERPRSVLALICGPPAMNQRAVKPNLEKMGYTEEEIFIF